MAETTLDATDLKLLDKLQHDASLSRKQLAQLCHISEATCSRRMASLTRRGYISKPAILLNPKKFGLSLSVFVLVTLEQESASAMKQLTDRWRKVPYVLSIDYISGEFDYMLHLVLRDMEHYQEFADEYLMHEAQVKKYLSLFQMKGLKRTSAIPVA